MQAKERIRCCPSCGARSIVKNGYRLRDFVGLPIGGKRVTIRMKVQRYKCKECDFDQQEKIPFATGSCSYTHRFAKYVVDLLRGMTLQDVSNHLVVSWDTVKEIHSSYLKRHYSPPSLDGVENIGIDEFAVKKGHVYKTIVVDLDSGRIIYVGDGKGSEALKKFWRKVKRKNIKIKQKHVATDLSAAFIASVMENCPNAVHVFDHFHVVKLMNEKLDDIRRKVYSMEKDINKRKVLKGTRYLLLGNGADIFDKQHKTRLENALAMNEPLSKAYYLKEQLHQIWSQPMKAMAEKVLDDWIRQAEQSKIIQLQKMAVTVKTYKKGILAWYDCHLSTGKVEGINNKIKVMKRNAYGFRDEKYFTLRLYALHDCRITRNVG
nr:ISL3 family transposase [Prevotella melaninogenica]